MRSVYVSTPHNRLIANISALRYFFVLLLRAVFFVLFQ